MTKTRSFASKGPVGCSENSDLEDGEKSGRATEEEVTERHSRWKQLWPFLKIILVLIFLLNILPNGLADPLGIKKLEL